MRLHLAVILLSLDAQAQAFQLQMGACSRAPSASRTTASPPSRLASPVQGYCRPKGAVVTRTSALHLSTGGAPEEGSGKGGAPTKVPEKATASSTIGKDVDGAEVKDGAGHASQDMTEEGAGGVKEGGDGAAVKAVAPKTPPPVAAASSAPSKETVVDESEFTELEKAFAEARKRSIEQGTVAKASVTKKPAIKKAPPAAADETADASAAPKSKAATPPEKPDASMPASVTSTSATAVSVPATEKPAPSAPSPAEKPPVTATPKGVAPSPSPKTPIPPEKPAVDSKEPVPIKPPATATPKAVAPSPSPKTSIPPEKPAVPIKAKESKPEPAEKAPTGAFSLAAESLEEFFGLTKKPLLVSTTTPPKKSLGSSSDDPSKMAELDKAAVESMLEENGLNEVTLKEDFRQMEAEAKAAAQGSGKKSPEATVKAKPPAEKPATPANPFESLTAIFNPPSPETASKETEAARPRVTAIEPEPEPEPERQQAPAATSDGGLRRIFSGMFAEPVYDDEVDTLPQKGSGAPRAMPVFAPPPAPAKAPVKAKEEPKEKSDAPGSSSPSLPFLDGLFGGGKKVEAPKPKSPAPAPARVRSPVQAKAEAPARAVEKEKPPAPSLFDGLFGGGGTADKVEPSSSTKKPVKSLGAPASKTSGKKAAPTQVKVEASSTPPGSPSASPLFGLFGGGKSEAKTATKKVASPPVPATKTPPPAPALPKSPALFNVFGASSEKGKASPPAPAPAVPAPIASKKSKPSVGGMFDFLGSVSTSTTKSDKQASAPPRPPPQPQPQQKQQQTKSSGANTFAGLFGGAGGVPTSAKKKTAAAAAVAKPKPKPKPKPKRQPLPPPTAAPAPMVSRVKTMDDAFLKKVSIMLKRNQTKIKKFQQLTDRFRGGLITASVYYGGVEDLFGEANVKEIIDPLLAALPEKDKSKALQMVYNKAQKAGSVSQGSAAQSQGGGLAGGLAGLLAGLGAKSGPSSSVASADSKKESKEASALSRTGKGKAGAPAADPYAFAASKLKDSDYQIFKTRTALFAKGGINARNYYDTLEKLFGKKGVPQQLQAVLKVLPQNKRKLIQDVCDALNK